MNVTVVWGYGTRNAGDTAINFGTAEVLNQQLDVTPTYISRYSDNSKEVNKSIQKLRRNGYDLNLFAGPISYNPKKQSKVSQISSLVSDSVGYITDILASRYTSLSTQSELAEQISNSDAVLFNGGNLLHHSPHRGFLPYLLAIIYPLVIARDQDVPYGLLPQTMFNLEGPYESIIVKLLNDAEFIWTRDKVTYRLLNNKPISTPIKDGIDIGFTACDQHQQESQNTPERTHIAVVPRLSKLGDAGQVRDRKAEKTIKRYVKHLADTGTLVTVVVQTISERKWVNENYDFLEQNHVNIYESYNPSDLCRFYARCDGLLTMRMHAGIFALTQGTPAVGIYKKEWGPKMPGTWEALGIDQYVVPLNKITVNNIKTLMSDAIHDMSSDETISVVDSKTHDMATKLSSDIMNLHSC